MVLIALTGLLALVYFVFRAVIHKRTPKKEYLKSGSHNFGEPGGQSPKQYTSEKLLQRRDVEALSPATWQRQSFDAFQAAILSEDPVAFPCIYATKGFKAHEHRYMFLESEDMSDERNVAIIVTALHQYLEAPQSKLGPNTSLVVLFPVPIAPSTMEDYYRKYWDCLHGLRALDPKPWPDHIPTNTDTPLWRFCFDGQPIFSAALTPAHEKRRSRCARCFCVVFQPDFVFDILFSTQLKKQSAISKVRSLLGGFDDVSISPELKDYGDETGRESKQYFIMDENYSIPCPYATLG